MTTEVETYIETGLQLLDEKEAMLKELAAGFQGLTVEGIEDKEGFEKVRKARITLKNERVAIETAAKELRDPAIKWQKKVIEREKLLISIIEPLEDELHAEEKRIEALKEEARQQKEMMEAKLLQDRLDALAAYNFAHDWVEVKHMTDDQFDEMLAHAKNLHEEEQKRQAEIKAEEERKRKEEEERLQKEREEFERQKTEQSRLNSRIQKVIKLGYQWNERYQNYQLEVGTLSDVIGLEELKVYSDEQFESFYSESVAGFTRERERLKKLEEEKKAEQERQEAAIRAEREKLEAERRAIEEEKRKHEENIRLEQAKKEAAERARIEEQERIKREAEEKAERERRAKVEAERQEALKPDKEKLMDYVSTIFEISRHVPQLQNDSSRQLYEVISCNLRSVAYTAVIKIEQL